MGTNYYLQLNKCPTCGRYEEIHIGKSSAGWPFHLHVTDEIQTLEDWLTMFRRGEIFNEYDDEIEIEEMLTVILCREKPQKRRDDIDVVEHRETYSLIKGDFS